MSDHAEKRVCLSIFKDGTVIPWDSANHKSAPKAVQGGLVFFRTASMHEAETLIRRLCKLRAGAATEAADGGYFYAGPTEDPWRNDVTQIDRVAARFAQQAERLEMQTLGGFRL